MSHYSIVIWLSVIFGIAGLSACSEQSPIDATDTADTVNNSDATGDSSMTDNTNDGDDTVNPADSTNAVSPSVDSTSVSGWSEDTSGTVQIGKGAITVTDADGHTTLCYETRCDGRLLECGDCKDNDGDGDFDWRDRECLGPCDNTEGPALISDVGGVTGSTCHVDCYFDFGNGMGTGSDDCWWSHECDPLEPEAPVCEYRESLVNNQKFCPTTQSDRCTEVCLPFTPNGCDCFGCCTFPELSGQGDNGGDAYVWIGAKDSKNAGMCTFEDILDDSKCPRCTPVANCLNECGHCEICIGKPTLPSDCYETDTDGELIPPPEQCPANVSPCNTDDALPPCDEGYYCVSGCCQAVITVE